MKGTGIIQNKEQVEQEHLYMQSKDKSRITDGRNKGPQGITGIYKVCISGGRQGRTPLINSFVHIRLKSGRDWKHLRSTSAEGVSVEGHGFNELYRLDLPDFSNSLVTS